MYAGQGYHSHGGYLGPCSPKNPPQESGSGRHRRGADDEAEGQVDARRHDRGLFGHAVLVVVLERTAHEEEVTVPSGRARRSRGARRRSSTKRRVAPNDSEAMNGSGPSSKSSHMPS